MIRQKVVCCQWLARLSRWWGLGAEGNVRHTNKYIRPVYKLYTRSQAVARNRI